MKSRSPRGEENNLLLSPLTRHQAKAHSPHGSRQKGTLTLPRRADRA